MGGKVKPGIELKISCSDIILNYQLSQKFKFLGNGEFNHLTINLTPLSSKYIQLRLLHQLLLNVAVGAKTWAFVLGLGSTL